MLRAIIVLSILLVISLAGNYSIYQKLQYKDLLISQQEVSLKDLDRKVKLGEAIKDIGDNVFKEVFHSTTASDKEFDIIMKSLPSLTVCDKSIVPVNGVINDTTKIPTSDVALISSYYDKLHSAYNLQNKY